jgi:uncharacterized protein (TIGR02147 family)
MQIFEFRDYKAYLQQVLANLPQRGRGEVNRMAAHLRVHPTLVSQVLRGAKDFTVEQAHRLCSYLGLQGADADGFLLLVQKERAGTAELRAYYDAKLKELKKQSLRVANQLNEHRALTAQDQAIFYSTWIYSAIRLFTSVGEGKTVAEVAERFRLPRTLVSEILAFLKGAGLCSEAEGRFGLGQRQTHLEFGSPFLSRHHTNWRLQSIRRAEGLGAEELMFTSPFSVSREDFAKIRSDLLQLIKRSSALIKDSPAEEIACMNLDLFWIGERE